MNPSPAREILSPDESVAIFFSGTTLQKTGGIHPEGEGAPLHFADQGPPSIFCRHERGGVGALNPEAKGVPPPTSRSAGPLHPQGTEGVPPLPTDAPREQKVAVLEPRGVVPHPTEGGGERGPRLEKSWSGGRGVPACVRQSEFFRIDQERGGIFSEFLEMRVSKQYSCQVIFF